MTRRLIIHAANIHLGGGAVLLRSLLNELQHQPDIELILQLDARFDLQGIELPTSTLVYRVRPSLIARLNAEYRLTQLASANSTVLCFGNLPPLFHLTGKVLVYVQNRYVLDPQISLQGFPLGVRIRIQIERWWFKYAHEKCQRMDGANTHYATIFGEC